ncbi:hypothetical protein DLAC_05389 [Tieghemostelium lacteum]|uniref:Transmembrane protein n=1 Tax=Tieghemostelium lacteum TaxID=361077 RepID=A0A151ZFR1_TIELA|nr:hypothetical protein DLAC_05389 [Tieghemostelium lacteum]|eukprot:KYQ92806.1 hypothetical protein DLAC_05389 [Tieghemostelium lacteum]
MSKSTLYTSLIYSVLFVGLCIVSLTTPWYVMNFDIKDTTLEPSGSKYLYFTKMYITVPSLDESEYLSYHDDLDTETAAVFKVSLICLIAGLAFIILNVIFLLFALFRHFQRGKKLAAFTMVCAMVAIGISFFQFIRVIDAIETDGLCDDSYDTTRETICNKFLGTLDDDYLYASYYPTFGWWSLYGCIMFGLVSLIATIKS